MTSDKQFEELMESVNSGILVIHNEKIVYANNYITKRFGAPKSGLVGKHVLDFIHPDKSKETKAQLKNILYNKNPVLGFETEIINAKGETRIVEINSAPTNFKNTPARIFSIKDITELRDTERDLTNSSKHFELLFNSLPFGGEVLNLEGIVMECSPSTAKMLEYTEPEIIGKHITKFLAKESIPTFKELYPKLIEGEAQKTEIKMVTKNGRELTILRAAQPLFDERGNVKSVLALNTDITEIRETESNLLEKELFQESILNSSSDVIYIYDFIEQKNIYSNNTIGDVLGYSVEEIQKFDHLIKDLMHPDDFKNYLEIILPHYQTAKDNELIEHEYRMRHKDGAWHWFLSKESIYKRDSKGNATQIFGVSSDITERKNIRNLLEEKERQMRSIYDDPSIFIGVLDIDGRIIDANKSALDFIEKKIKDVNGVKFWDTPWWSHSKEQQELLKSAYKKAQKGISASFDAEHVNPNGDSLIVNFSIRPIKNNDGKIVEFLVEGINITEQVHAEKGLRESEKRYRALSENAPVGVWHADIKGNVTYINPKLSEISGLTSDEATGGHWGAKVHPEDRDRVLQEWDNYIDGEKPYTSMYRFVHDSGEIHWVLENATTIFDDKNKKFAHIGTITDITDRKKYENELLTEKNYGVQLVDSLPGLFYEISPEGRFTNWNKNFEKITGYTSKEITEMNPTDLFVGKEKKYITDRISEVFKNGYSTAEANLVSKKGNRTPYFFTGNLVNINDVPRLIGMGIDVSEQKEQEKKLIESEESYQLLSDATFEAIFISEKGICTGQNKTAEQMFGYTLEEAIGKFGTEWIAPEFRDDVMNKMMTGYEKPYEAIALKKDGSTFPCEIQARMMEKNGKQIRLTALRDISERKNTQQRLELTMESARLGSWDQNYKTGVVLRNDRWYEMLGYNKDEIKETKLAWIELIHPDDVPVVKKASQDQDKGKSDYLNVEHRLKTKSGKWKWILNWGKIIERDKNGNPLRAVGTHLDIDAKKKIELSLKDSENKFRSILENVQLLAVMLDDKANITFANRFLLKKTGWKKKEVIGNNYFDLFVSKDARTSSKNRFNEIKKSRALFSNRVNDIITKDGKQLTVDWNVTAQYDDEGNLLVVTSIGTDITDKLKIESDLRFQSELIKQSYESMITTDLDFKINWTNEAFTKLFGYKREEVLGKTPDFLNADPMAKEIQQGIYESMQAGKLLRTTLLNKKKDGSNFVCEVAIYPVLDINGEVIAYSGHQYDVTERVTAKKELEESEKKYHDLFEHQLEAYAYHEIILNKKGEAVNYKFLDVNDQFLKELEIKDKKDVIGKTLFELDPKIDKKWIKYYGKVALTGKPKKFEEKFAQNGKWYKIYAYSPKKRHFATSFIDITDEKKAEEDIKQSEERFRSTFESVGEGIILISKDGKVNYVNESLIRMIGIDYKDIVGIHVLKLAKKMVSAKELPIVTKNILNAFDFKKLKPFDVNYNEKIINVSVAYNKLNKNIIGILHDVTDKKKTDIELQEHRNHLEELVEKRTIDLKKKNEELDNALKVFVGRELTIKNLRSEISKLEKKIKSLKN